MTYIPQPPASSVKVPVATTTSVGGVKIGTGLAVATDGTLSIAGNAGGGTVGTVSDLTALIVSLPTTLPGSPGQLWLNGNALSVS